jgi:hypothetical protein
MFRITQIAFCVLLIFLLGLPAFAGGKPACKPQPSITSNVTGTVYDTGSGLVERTEGLVSGCFRSVFSFFNPCLDVVKGCTSRVLAPIERPFDCAENWVNERLAARKQAAVKPQPKKQAPPVCK